MISSILKFNMWSVFISPNTFYVWLYTHRHMCIAKAHSLNTSQHMLFFCFSFPAFSSLSLQYVTFAVKPETHSPYELCLWTPLFLSVSLLFFNLYLSSLLSVFSAFLSRAYFLQSRGAKWTGFFIQTVITYPCPWCWNHNPSFFLSFFELIMWCSFLFKCIKNYLSVYPVER